MSDELGRRIEARGDAGQPDARDSAGAGRMAEGDARPSVEQGARDRIAQRLAESEHLLRYRDARELPRGDARDVKLSDLATDVAATDPELAFTAAGDVVDAEVRDATYASIAGEMAPSDPTLARAAVDTITDLAGRDAGYAMLAGKLATSNPASSLDAVAAISDPESKVRAYAEVAERMATDHPHLALRAVRDLSRTQSAAGSASEDSLPDLTRAAVAERAASGPHPKFAVTAITGIGDHDLQVEAARTVVPTLMARGERRLATELVDDLSVATGARAQQEIDQLRARLLGEPDGVSRRR